MVKHSFSQASFVAENCLEWSDASHGEGVKGQPSWDESGCKHQMVWKTTTWSMAGTAKVKGEWMPFFRIILACCMCVDLHDSVVVEGRL